MKRYCLALDLVDDPKLIAEYEQYHVKIWPEIHNLLQILALKTWNIPNWQSAVYDYGRERKFFIRRKGKMDAQNPKVQEWENLMWKYQQALPMAKSGEKWLLMDKIFDLKDE